MTDPRSVESPEVLDSLRLACASVRGSVDGSLLELCRRRVAMLLGVAEEDAAPPWGDVDTAKLADLMSWAESVSFDDRDRAALALAEQFVIDVSGVADGPLASSAGVLGAEIGPLVQGLYLLDVGMRIEVVLGQLVGESITSADWAWPGADSEIPADPMDAIMAMMAAVGRLQVLDPVTKELVRLRGARLHQCRRCQSVRSVAAIDAGASEELLGADDPVAISSLSLATAASIELVDATFIGRPALDDELRGRLTREMDSTELVELVGYLLRNACNKIAVAFGADAAIVDEGFEFQIIDAAGETITVDAPTLG